MNYQNDQIELNPSSAKAGDKVHIKYHGLLKNSGADAVFLYYGKDGWNQSHFVPMDRGSDGFSTEIKADADRELNFCFKDSANNWDNNNGFNWKVDIYH